MKLDIDLSNKAYEIRRMMIALVFAFLGTTSCLDKRR